MRRLFAAPHNVCFWHKADMTTALTDVRFWGQHYTDIG